MKNAKFYTAAVRGSLSQINKTIKAAEENESSLFLEIADTNYAILIDNPNGNCEVLTNYTKDGFYKPLRNQLSGNLMNVVDQLKKRIKYWESQKQ